MAAVGECDALAYAIEDIVEYFDCKTEAILHRYGPGPRVHYHAGLIDHPPSPDAPAHSLRQRLIAGQERALRYAIEAWKAAPNLKGEVLDVGCGLGGGAIFLAQEFGAKVTAVTCVPSHIRWVTRFAAEAGVESLVRPVLADATQIPGENCFDAVIAVDSSGYLPRKPWFRRLASLLRPGGHAFIVDCFVSKPDYEKPFNRHWRTRIGTTSEYQTAALDAGLLPGVAEDISRRTEHFWTTTLALLQIEAREPNQNPAEVHRRQQSKYAHDLVRRGLAEGSLSYELLSYFKS